MPAIRRHWTPDDVRDLMDESHAWPRYELIAGELIVTPSPGSPHQIAVLELCLWVASYVEREGLGLTLISPSDLELKKETITQPDLFVVPVGPGKRDRAFAWREVTGLLLAVEIISPSSVRTDRVTKRDHYMESNVAEYWVVDLDSRLVERWTPERETPLVARNTLVWQPEGAANALTIELPVLFDRIRDKARSIPR